VLWSTYMLEPNDASCSRSMFDPRQQLTVANLRIPKKGKPSNLQVANMSDVDSFYYKT